jgi:hypothetical protein
MHNHTPARARRQVTGSSAGARRTRPVSLRSTPPPPNPFLTSPIFLALAHPTAASQPPKPPPLGRSFNARIAAPCQQHKTNPPRGPPLCGRGPARARRDLSSPHVTSNLPSVRCWARGGMCGPMAEGSERAAAAVRAARVDRKALPYNLLVCVCVASGWVSASESTCCLLARLRSSLPPPGHVGNTHPLVCAFWTVILFYSDERGWARGPSSRHSRRALSVK